MDSVLVEATKLINDSSAAERKLLFASAEWKKLRAANAALAERIAACE